MFQKFTDRARKAMDLASSEAVRFNHECIGTEHILLGLIKEGRSVAANVLQNLGGDLRRIQEELEKIIAPGPEPVKLDNLPTTPRAKKAIAFAAEEARNLGHEHIGTEHLLLGLLREQEGVAAQVLTILHLKLPDVRAAVLKRIGRGQTAGGEEDFDPDRIKATEQDRL
jgi:ATP-dependent Clp protease ATP-binding subunit ClpC